MALRKIIEKLGQLKLTFYITILSLIFAELFAYVFIKLLGFAYIMPDTPITAALIAIVMTPILSWHILGLLINIDKLEKKMSKLANYDEMTSHFRRHFFIDKAQVLHNQIITKQSHYALLVIDMDNFKQINDNYGHAIGDEVLKYYGKLAKGIFNHKDDLLARMGGEEFTIFTTSNLHTTLNKAEELRQQFSQYKINQKNILTQCSISIGVFENIYNKFIPLEEALNYADKALYQAKIDGKNRINVFTWNHKIKNHQIP